MTLQAKPTAAGSLTDASQVIDYLRDNPEFFNDNSELLAGIRLRHETGKAVSLIERQVELLREQNGELKTRLLDLVQVARDNDRLNERMHHLVLALLKAGSFTALLDTLCEHLHSEFYADAVALHLAGLSDNALRESGATAFVIDERTQALFQTPLGASKPLCGRLNTEQLAFLFGDQAAALESAAVIPLGDKGSGGLIAVGSREPQRFFSGMGTLFLSRLGEVIGLLLARLNPDA